MTTYREYRGLYGEPVRVPEDTIAPARRHQSRGRFPFAAIAAQLGRERDNFANVALQVKLFEDLARSRVFRAGRFQLQAA